MHQKLRIIRYLFRDMIGIRLEYHGRLVFGYGIIMGMVMVMGKEMGEGKEKEKGREMGEVNRNC